jgi:hypothetical protein
MNKNLMLTALLIAVMCQPVSAVAPKVDVPISMMSNAYTAVTSFVKNHKMACSVFGVSGLLYGGYKYLLKKRVQWYACVEAELDQLVAEVKETVAKDTYVTFERIEASENGSDLWPTIKRGKYFYLEALYPKLIELANTYMTRMNDLLRTNMNHDHQVIAQYRASEAAYAFNHYAIYDVLLNVSTRPEKEGWAVNKYGIKMFKYDSAEYKAKFYRLSSTK